jgi:hypothetical protein
MKRKTYDFTFTANPEAPAVAYKTRMQIAPWA